MSFFATLLPARASNDFRGGKVPLYGFLLLIAFATFRSSVHFFAPDSGVNSIASIHLFPGKLNGRSSSRILQCTGPNDLHGNLMSKSLDEFLGSEAFWRQVADFASSSCEQYGRGSVLLHEQDAHRE